MATVEIIHIFPTFVEMQPAHHGAGKGHQQCQNTPDRTLSEPRMGHFSFENAMCQSLELCFLHWRGTLLCKSTTNKGRRLKKKWRNKKAQSAHSPF